MGDLVEDNANEIIEARLDQFAEDLEERFIADLLAFSGRITYGADTIIRDAVEWKKTQKPTRKRLVFFLQTEGGFIEVTQRIATTLRKHYREVRFVVPDAAMSAGTVLVMSGDAVYMDYYSALGPIDPQLPKADGTGYVPALGYIKKYEELMEKSGRGSLTTAEITYLCTKFDPAELYQYEQAREMSIFLLKEWLVKYKFKRWKRTKTRKKKVTLAMRRQRAKDIAEILNDTERWHTHGHGISMAVVRRTLKLQVEDFGKSRTLQKLIRGYWGLLADYSSKMRHKGFMHGKGRYKPLGW